MIKQGGCHGNVLCSESGRGDGDFDFTQQHNVRQGVPLCFTEPLGTALRFTPMHQAISAAPLLDFFNAGRTPLVTSHDTVHITCAQVINVRITTKATVRQQYIATFQHIPQTSGQGDLADIKSTLGHIQDDAAGEGKIDNDTHNRETAALFL